MKVKVNEARDVLRFVPPQLNSLLLKCARLLSPLYLRAALHLRVQPPQHIEPLLDEYKRFFEDESKLILVFRHVHVHDAQVMFHLFNNITHSQAKKRRIPYPRRPHAHFLYGRGVPVWGGAYLEWVFSRLGGIPVHHRKLDREGLDALRRYMQQGPYPIALAPEGQVTYHNEIIYEIEPGFAQLAMWARYDVSKAGGSQDVRILPISQYYDYGEEGVQIRSSLIDRLIKETGIELEGQLESDQPATPILHQIGAQLLTEIENFYAHFYNLTALAPQQQSGHSITKDRSDAQYKWGDCNRRRVEHLVDEVLKMQERRLGIQHPPTGFTPRIYIVRLAGWNRIFVRNSENAEQRTSAAPLDQELQDFLATEAGLFARHLEVVDLLAYLQPEYALESDDANRHIEFLLNLLDAVNRLKGGTIGQRKHPGSTNVKLSIGEPISLNSLSTQKSNVSDRQLRSELVERVQKQFEVLAAECEQINANK